MSFQGHVVKGLVVLDSPLPLPDGTPVRVEPIAQIGFWESVSLPDLAASQGVVAPRSVDELLSGWPADECDDDFEIALRGWRNGEAGAGS